MFWEGDNLNPQIEKSMEIGELQDMELFVFTNNMVFESVFYKGNSKILLLFEILLRLHQVNM